MNTRPKFWKRPPSPYWRDLRAWALLLPALAATLGGIAYSIQGLAVSNGGILPAQWVDTAIKWGAVLLGIGGEGGTLAACIEIARKQRDGDAQLIRVFGKEVSEDTIGLLVSYLATVTARLLAINTGMAGAWEIKLLVFAAAADAYFLYKEAGDYLSIRDRAMGRYQTALWYYEQGQLPAALAALKSDAVIDIAEEVRVLRVQLHAQATATQAAQQEIATLQAQVREGNLEEERLRDSLRAVVAERDELAAAQTVSAPVAPEHTRRTLEYYRENPHAPFTQAARDLGISASGVRNHVATLETLGLLRRNGHVEVVG